MANVVQLKRSSISGRVPDASNVQVGEPVINLADQVLYTKDGSGTIKVIGAGTTTDIAEGTNLYFTNARAISAFTTGEGISLDSNGFISTSISSGATLSETAPISPSNGDTWLNTTNKTLNLFTGSKWEEFSRLAEVYFEEDYDLEDYDSLKFGYNLEELKNVDGLPQAGDLLSYNGVAWKPVSSISSIQLLHLAPLSSEPTNSSLGSFAVADGINWNPSGKEGLRPYPVFFDGVEWMSLY